MLYDLLHSILKINLLYNTTSQLHNSLKFAIEYLIYTVIFSLKVPCKQEHNKFVLLYNQ